VMCACMRLDKYRISLALIVRHNFVIVQAGAYASSDGILTEKMVDEKVDDSIRAHQKKIMWRSEQEKSEHGSTAKAGALPLSAKDLAAFTPPSSSGARS
jgi:hypothetical protein